MKREDVEWALAASTASSGATCARRAIGPDLLMLYAALRRGEPGRYITTTRVHFTAGDDSISVNADPRDLADCYNAARSYLLAHCPDAAGRVAMRLALALYRIRHRRFTVESLGPSIDTADASIIDWVTGTSVTAAGIGRYLRTERAVVCRCGHGRGEERGCTRSRESNGRHEPVQTSRQDSSGKRRGGAISVLARSPSFRLLWTTSDPSATASG